MKTTARTDDHIPPKPRRNMRRRRYATLLFPLTILMLLFLSVSASAELRMIDQGALLRAYGFPNGRYDAVEAMIHEIDPSIEVPVGHIEGDASLDSALEFLTAARYGGVRLSEAGRRVISRELPHGRAGDLKLGAAWLVRRSRDQISTEECNCALTYVSSRSGIPVSEFRRYFRSEVTRKLVEVARREFPAGTPLPQTIQPLIDYVASFDGRGNLRVNDQALFNDLVSSIRECRSRNTPDYVAYMATVDTVSNDLGRRIDNSISGSSVSMMTPLNNNGRVVAQNIRRGR